MKDKGSQDKTTMTTREVAVLIEDLRSQFRIFGEQLKAVEARLEGKIEGISANQAKTLEKITSLEITVRKIQTDIADIKDTFKTHDKRISHLETISK